MKNYIYLILSFLTFTFISCKKESDKEIIKQWDRVSTQPIYRDSIPNENYQVASDPHVFFEGNHLKMIYSGDEHSKPSIKLADGLNWTSWKYNKTLLSDVGPSGLDSNKETAYYRKAKNGKHQIYYIGYESEISYKAQIFLAEADSLTGTYTQMNHAIIPRGLLAGKNVYCMTSPSVVEHQGVLYMTFIGWDNSPNNVTEVWIIGATSIDEGLSWSNFQLIDSPIGMEGQITKIAENKFVAVRTASYCGKEAIYYATANHPFGPWNKLNDPILIQAGAPYEKDEIIAPQITQDPISKKEYLYYTGADYKIGWWIMLASR